MSVEECAPPHETTGCNPCCPCAPANKGVSREQAATGKSAKTITISYEGGMHAIARQPGTDTQLHVGGTASCGGPGEHLSPLDLLATAYGSCVIMAMDMAAQARAIDLVGSSVHIALHMAPSGPPSIEEIEATIVLPRDVGDAAMEVLRKGSESCPIHRALGPGAKKTLTIQAKPDRR